MIHLDSSHLSSPLQLNIMSPKVDCCISPLWTLTFFSFQRQSYTVRLHFYLWLHTLYGFHISLKVRATVLTMILHSILQTHDPAITDVFSCFPLCLLPYLQWPPAFPLKDRHTPVSPAFTLPGAQSLPYLHDAHSGPLLLGFVYGFCDPVGPFIDFLISPSSQRSPSPHFLVCFCGSSICYFELTTPPLCLC